METYKHLYPGATPEFRMLKKQNGDLILQVCYVSSLQGYKSGWLDVPIVVEAKIEEKISE